MTREAVSGGGGSGRSSDVAEAEEASEVNGEYSSRCVCVNESLVLVQRQRSSLDIHDEQYTAPTCSVPMWFVNLLAEVGKTKCEHVSSV